LVDETYAVCCASSLRSGDKQHHQDASGNAIGEDILNFGVPENVNSAYAESAHIPISKVISKNAKNAQDLHTSNGSSVRQYLAIHRGHGMIDTKYALVSHNGLNNSTGNCSKWMLYHIWNNSDGKKTF
jgi:hypothetical protein